MDNRNNSIMSGLTQTEIDSIYRMQKRVYWEADFVNRYIDRRLGGVGLCNLPYETLVDEKMILDTAYGLYCDMEDCNVAYNDTLDAETAILQYERGTRIKRAEDMITSHPDAEYGRCLSIRYQPHQQEDLDRLLQREWREREHLREGDADTYIENRPGLVSRVMRKRLSIK